MEFMKNEGGGRVVKRNFYIQYFVTKGYIPEITLEKG
jgi:hypothetical protein